MIFRVDVEGGLKDFSVWVHGTTRNAVEKWAKDAYWHISMRIEEDRRPAVPHCFHWLGGEDGTKRARAKA